MDRNIIFIIIIFAHSILMQGKTVQIIDNPNITLQQIITDDKINKNEIIGINDSFQCKIISNLCKGGIDPSYQEICLNAFTQWCNNFVKEERNFVVFRMPLLKSMDFTDFNWENENIHNDNIFSKKKSTIIIDPFFKDIPINNYLMKNDVVISVSMPAGGFSALRLVEIRAIIPINGEYFKYEYTYVFELTIDFKKFKTKDTNKISQIIGGDIADTPNYFIHKDGGLSDHFLIYNFNWEYFKPNSSYKIMKIDIHPESKPLFLYDLIYQFDLN